MAMPTPKPSSVARLIARFHQGRCYTITNEIASGSCVEKLILADCFPRTGKLMMSLIHAGILLDRNIVDAVLLLTPRSSLVNQVDRQFNKETRQMEMPDGTIYNLNGRYKLRANTGHVPLLRSNEGNRLVVDTQDGKRIVGAASTYQGINDGFVEEIVALAESGVRLLLIIDEFHHLYRQKGDKPEQAAERAGWASAVTRIYDAATQVLAMSGTMERHDGKPLPFIPYVEKEFTLRDGKKVKRLVPARVHITYTHRHARADNAVRSIDLQIIDGYWQFVDTDGKSKSGSISECKKSQLPKALQTLLVPKYGYRNGLIDRTMEFFLEFKRMHPWAQVIFIERRIKSARSAARYLQKKYPHLKVGVAVSKDGAEAHKVIEAFSLGPKSPGVKYDILVTVGMAHEGMDAPYATHLGLLTDIRSYAWIVQAIMRVGTVNYDIEIPPDRQVCRLFVPDDERLIQEILIDMISDQLRGVNDRREEKRKKDQEEGREQERRSITPEGAEMGDVSYATIGEGDHVPHNIDDNAILNLVFEEGPEFKSWDHDAVLKLFKMGQQSASPAATAVAPVSKLARVSVPQPQPQRPLTEKELRERIQALTNTFDNDMLLIRDDWSRGRANTLLKGMYGNRSRKSLNIEELMDQYEFMKRVIAGEAYLY